MGFSLTKLPNDGVLQKNYTVAEAKLILDEVNMGSGVARGLFKEAMLHTDLPHAFTSLTNKALLPQYAQATPKHGEFTREVTLTDLREQGYIEQFPDLSNLPDRPGGKERKGPFAPKIGPNNEYPAIGLDESETKLRIDKYGLRMPLTIEMIINDQLGVLANYPAALAVFLRQIEDLIVAEALMKKDGSGVLDSLTHVTGNPVLSVDAVAEALDQFDNVIINGNRANLSGSPTLVIPRQLKRLAERISSIATYDYTDADGKVWKGAANPAFGLKTVVLDTLTVANNASNAAATWFLVADGGDLLGRPSIAFSRLSGFIEPQQYISSPNALTPAGGLAAWNEGSFLNDSIEFKARHWVGAKVVYPEGILVSTPA